MFQYRKGDATKPDVDGPWVLAHCCNDKGGWGAGFVTALSDRWPSGTPNSPEDHYRAWYRAGTTPDMHPLGAQTTGNPLQFSLGACQLVEVEPACWVANIIGQHGFASFDTKPPIRYKALLAGLLTASAFCQGIGATLVAPRLGAGLAGGRWDVIEAILVKIATKVGVVVYDL